jgi:hypothetical protein
MTIDWTILIQKKFVKKRRQDIRSQLHQHIKYSFCADIFAHKKVQTLNLSTKELGAKLSYEKAARKMLVKVTPVS